VRSLSESPWQSLVIGSTMVSSRGFTVGPARSFLSRVIASSKNWMRRFTAAGAWAGSSRRFTWVAGSSSLAHATSVVVEAAAVATNADPSSSDRSNGAILRAV
jgi:hypothetical protein